MQPGEARADRFAQMAGIDALKAMMAGDLPGPSIGATMGFRLVEVAPGFARFEGTTGPHLLNPLGIVHGGFALTLIDSAAGCAVHTTLPAGVGYTTVETKANMTRAIRADAGVVSCEGRVVAQGRQIVTAEARLTDADGRLLAHGTSTLMILHPR